MAMLEESEKRYLLKVLHRAETSPSRLSAYESTHAPPESSASMARLSMERFKAYTPLGLLSKSPVKHHFARHADLIRRYAALEEIR